MSRLQQLVKTAEFKGFLYGFAACVALIFGVAAFTSSAITFTASNAVMFTPVPRFVLPPCPCSPNVTPAPEPLPTRPFVPDQRKKKGDVGEKVSMLDCVGSCNCSGRSTEGCTCITASAVPVRCPCSTCPCDNEVSR